MFCMQRKTTGKRGQRRGEVPGMSDRGCCLRWFLTVALGGDRRWLFFFFSSASPCFFFLWLFTYSTALLVSFLSLLWCWGRRCWWWCWVSSAGFLLPWPSLRLFSCYRFHVLLPLVLADGVVGRWSWWWCFFFLFFSPGWTFSRRVLLAWSDPVWFSKLYSLLLPLFLLSLVRSSFVFFFCVFLSLLPPVSIVSPSVFFFRLSLPSFICLSSCVPHCHLSFLVSFPLPCV